MQRLSASSLLSAWERGRDQPPLRRALLLLQAASPDESPESFETLPLGRRDARLLDLRTMIFGPRLDAIASCPRCAETLEFAIHAADLAGLDALALESSLIQRDPYEVTARAPSSADLLEIVGLAPEERRRALAERCVVEGRRGDAVVAPEALPDDLVDLIVEHMDEADPLAHLSVALACPACEHAWNVPFDMTSFLWAELEAWADRTLRDVHVLASAYAWSESSILSMSAWRRRRYLEMVEG